MVFAQNLVSNPDFEQQNKCPKGFDLIKYASGWDNPNNGTADYFHRCSKKVVGVPQNNKGKQEAQSGDGYAGIIAFQDDSYGQYREYIQSQLLQPLVKNKRYRVMFYANLSDDSGKAINHLGVFFSRRKIEQNNNTRIYVEPYIDSGEELLMNKERWMPIEGVFTAKGGETHIIIGCFHKNVKLKRQSMFPRNQNKDIRAYYYIDNVVVEQLPDEVEEQPITTIDSTTTYEVGQNMVLNHVNFEYNKATLLPSSFGELNELAAYLKKHPTADISIHGHTDDLGQEAYNQNLSLKRAVSVGRYLTEQGIDQKRIKCIGYGSEVPIASNLTEEGRATNRRVEFKIVQK